MLKYKLEQWARIGILVLVAVALITGFVILITKSNNEVPDVEPTPVITPTQTPTPTPTSPTSIITRPDTQEKTDDPSIAVTGGAISSHDASSNDYTLSEGEFFVDENGNMTDANGQPVYLPPNFKYNQETGESTTTFD